MYMHSSVNYRSSADTKLVFCDNIMSDHQKRESCVNI